MGFQAIASGIDGSELNLGYTPLISNGLKYINFFGGDVPVNRNLYGADGASTGNPVAGTMSNGTTFQEMVNYIDTKVAHEASMTFIVIMKPTSQAMQISNFVSAATGINIALSAMKNTSDNTYNLRAYYGVLASGASTHTSKTAETTAKHAEGSVFAAALRFNGKTASGQVFMTVNDLTAGTLGRATADGSAVTQDIGSTLRIGSGYSNWNGGNGKPQILFAGIWNRELSDTEIQSQYSQLKSFYGNVKGVSI